MIKILGFKII